MRPIHNTMVTLMLVAMAQTVGCTADTEAYDDGMTGEVALDEVDEALSSVQPGDEAANADDVEPSERRSGATPRNGSWGWDNGWDRHGSSCHRDDFFHRNPCHRDDFFHRNPCHRDDFFCKFPCHHDDFFCKFPCHHDDFFCKFPCSFNSFFPCFP
ncbi:hypothetical protein WMF04_15930 [Sorangium sp. So ce260]|uniref:hypothetical protein n=1 Tax=Sorangium sp. So ce260 TaxID=3133291 RepID=UPI003F5E3D22